MKNKKTKNNNFLKYLIVVSLIVFYKPVYSQTLLPFLKANGKYIYVDSATMQPVISKEFDLAFRFKDSLAWIVVNNKFGLINNSGNEIFSPKYYRIRSFTKQSSYWGIEFKYELNNLRVRMEDKEKLIDGVRKEIFINAIPFNLSFYNGVACVADSLNKWALIDNKGNEITPFIYDDLKNTSYNFISFKKNNATGYINFLGKELFNKYNFDYGYNPWAFEYDYGIACVLNNGKFGLIDTSGNLIMPCESSRCYGYELIEEYLLKKNGYYTLPNGFKIFKKQKEIAGWNQNEWGVINNSGLHLSSKSYKSIRPLDSNFCIVYSYDDNKGVMDKEGNEIIKPIYSSIEKKKYGFECRSNVFFYFNEKGIEIPKLDSSRIESVFHKSKNNPDKIVYKFIKFLYPNTYSTDHFYGLMDNDGVVKLKPIYDYIGQFKCGFAWVSKDNKWGVIDSIGNIVTPVNIEINRLGNIVIPTKKTKKPYFRYLIEIIGGRRDPFQFLKSGYSLVISDNLFYFINKKGIKNSPIVNVKVPPFYYSKTFYDGYEINLPKEFELEYPSYDYDNFENGFAWFKNNNNKYFLISDSGQEYREK